MESGEIWVVDIPISDGKEQRGTRPVVLVARLEAEMVMIIPCTSKLAARRFTHIIELKPDRENGLEKISIALLFQMRAIDQKRLVKKIGKINDREQSRINQMLRAMLSLNKYLPFLLFLAII